MRILCLIFLLGSLTIDSVHSVETVLTGEDLAIADLQYDYGVVVDAGSSGSRLWVYRWLRMTDRNQLPDIRAVTKDPHLNSFKFEIGLSTFADNPGGLSDFLSKMLEPAKSVVPQSLQNNTELVVLATAGMRLLLDDKANDLNDMVLHILSNSSFNPFKFDKEYGARILSGEEEGLFAWIAVNYLKGIFKKRMPASSSFGLLELGGASTQIAFVPKGTPLANKYPARLRDQRYPLYVHSYLRYGLNYVEIGIMERLKDKNSNQTTVSNPCLLRGDMFSYESTLYIGTGNPRECLELLHNLIYKVSPNLCHPKPCAIGSTYQPRLPSDMKFLVIGAFVPSLKDLKTIDSQGNFVLNNVSKKTFEFCQRSFVDLMTETPHLKKYLSKTCLGGLYTVLLLNKGYGFPMNSTNLMVAKEIDGQKISWTMGAQLYELVFLTKRR